MSTKKKTAKKASPGSDMLKIGDRTISRTKYRDELLDKLGATENAAECKQIRHKLRTKCGHKGGLRTRTWTDAEGEKHHVDHKVSKKVVSTTKKKKKQTKTKAKAS